MNLLSNIMNVANNGLKETRNSYFHVSPKMRRFISIQHISLSNSKIITVDTYHYLEQICSFKSTTS